MTDEQQEVWDVVCRLNAAWTRGSVEDLGQFFHREMVAITPMDKLRLEGAQACTRSWERFCEKVEIKDWRADKPLVRVFRDAAVVTYYYDMVCSAGAAEFGLSGRDMFLLVREDGEWLAVANQFSPYPAEEGGIA